ncbi:MAG: hypothetical protein U5K79_14190 [Cyclobacteriaceae bacterium]|nr:hypothetical protein [Cyclobacteriaceae bacterium]
MTLLGMSYKNKAAAPWMTYIFSRNGFDAGVHGVEYDDINKMKDEFNRFQVISDLDSLGIGCIMWDALVNLYENGSGNYDTSEFNKTKPELKQPCKIGRISEFLLYIMDSYILNQLETAKDQLLN